MGAIQVQLHLQVVTVRYLDLPHRRVAPRAYRNATAHRALVAEVRQLIVAVAPRHIVVAALRLAAHAVAVCRMAEDPRTQETLVVGS